MAQPPPNPLPSGISPKKLVLFAALFVALSALGVYAIYSQVGDRTLRFDERLLELPTLAALGALLLAYFAADGLRLYYALKALGQPIAARDLAPLVFINIFFSNITPMATGGGFAQIWYLQRHGVSIGAATAATTIRTLLAMAFIFAATPFCLFNLSLPFALPFGGNMLFSIALIVGLYVGFFVVLVLRTRWLLVPLGVLFNGLIWLRLLGHARAGRWRFRVKRELLRFSHSFASYLKGPRHYIALSVFFTAAFLLSLFSFPAVLMWGLGYEVDYQQVLALLVITTFIMYFAPTPGASGIAEGVFAKFFAGVIGGQHLLLVTVAWRFFTIYIGVIIGVVVTQLELVRAGSKGGRA